ncbi:hypothetical protein FHS59_003452 [Algoriphagus iocasae]|uniref:Uncharacterized protein n=1 Tax=Algoriphagus iocasae TaxID=1836499 RepID=A0A841MQD8_9BACT|nr:hypothetical protein [Algoriphagus iocasae]
MTISREFTPIDRILDVCQFLTGLVGFVEGSWEGYDVRFMMYDL